MTLTPQKIDGLCKVEAYEGGGGWFVVGLIGKGYATRQDAEAAASKLRKRYEDRMAREQADA